MDGSSGSERVIAARPDISSRTFFPIVDALRALAVVSVVGYHAGVPFLPGGFVGVDVFFVISGFLIINHILNEQRRDGGFRFSAFYARRALRILPPYVLVIVVTLALAPVVLALPSEFAELSREVMWSAGMAANYLFLSQQGYFDADAATKPLLHLWSLAVEEQFYLVVPLLIAGAFVIVRRFSPPSAVIWTFVVAAFVASLVGCVLLTDPDRNNAFYQMPLRAWEFIAGGALGAVIPLLGRLPSRALDALIIVGLLAIVVAIATYSSAMPFPSYTAILPVLGACLVIAAGIARGGGLLTSILTPAPVLFVGLISYSLYLWHWPLLTYVRLYNWGEADVVRDLLAAAVAVVLAVLTLFLVERPILRLRRSPRSLSWLPSAVGAIALLVTGFAGASYGNTMTVPFLPAGSGACNLAAEADPACAIGKTGIIIGDSHAEAMFNEASKLSPEKVSLFSVASCPPIFDANMSEGGPSRMAACADGKDRLRGWLADGSIAFDYAVISARWSIYINSKVSKIDADNPNGLKPRVLFERLLKKTLSELQSRGVDRILIVGPVPTLPKPAYECVLRAQKYGIPVESKCAADAKDALRKTSNAVDWLRSAVGDDPNIRVVEPAPLFCDEQYCSPYDETFLYTDEDHLSDAGVRKVMDAFRDDFEWVARGERTL